MAVKKTAKTSGAAKAAAPKRAAAPKKSAAPKQDAAAKTAAPKQSAAPKAAAAKAAPKSAAAPKKKAAPVKLTDKQADLLKRVKDAGGTGYTAAKAEGKGLESLQAKKLIKRGAKDKEKGLYRYSVSKAGEKHLSTPPTPKD